MGQWDDSNEGETSSGGREEVFGRVAHTQEGVEVSRGGGQTVLSIRI